MKSDKFIRIAPWLFLTAAMILPLFAVVWIVSALVLITGGSNLSKVLHPILIRFCQAIYELIPYSMGLCIVLAVVAGLITSGKTFKKPMWWIGFIAWGIVALLLFLVFPHQSLFRAPNGLGA